MPFISKRKNNLGNQKRSYRRPRKIHVNNSKKNMFGGVSSTTEDNNEDKVNAIANELKELYNKNEDLINKANSLGGNLSEDDIRELQNIITFYEEKSKEYEAINESLGLFPDITDKDTFDDSVEYIKDEFALIIERLKENFIPI